MTPASLKACAKFLGNEYTLSGGGLWKLSEDDALPPMNDAELFYALLLKVDRELVWRAFSLPVSKAQRWIISESGIDYEGHGPTPLDALAAAIEKLEQESGK